MSESLPARIYRAITERPDELPALMAAHPDQLYAHTFMAGQTWLGYACQKGALDAVRHLLALGANPNLGDSHTGALPLVSACEFGHHDAAALLIAHGSRLDIASSEVNPLFAAVIGRSPSCAALLLEAGIDAAARYDGLRWQAMDALAFALMRGEQGCADLIVQHLAPADTYRAEALLTQASYVADLNAYPAKDPRAAVARTALAAMLRDPTGARPH